MNVHIGLFLAHDGSVQALEPLLRDIGESLIKHGYGSAKEDDAIAKSVLVVEESNLRLYDNPALFIDSVIKDAFFIVVPVEEQEEMNDASSGD